eukprot:TRINITY_DN14941_c0_g1_i2.p1 TRINITY_DN14941_c0_g1~~TRINITY_DN14941_c0_g1_i2.p1  ORF type:complete len:827 (+),score=67.72 TRINITY_DN14941_c0_g1_i2:49-2529(+)
MFLAALLMVCASVPLPESGAVLSGPVLYINVSTLASLNAKNSAPQWSAKNWEASLADELNIDLSRLRVTRTRGGPEEGSFTIMNTMASEYTSPQLTEVVRDKPLDATLYLSGVIGTTKAGLRSIAVQTAQDLAAMYNVSSDSVHAVSIPEASGVRIRYSVDVRGHSPQGIIDTYAAYLSQGRYNTTSIRQSMIEAMGGSSILALLKNESTLTTITLQGLALGSLSPMEMELLNREAAKAIGTALGSGSVVNTLLRSTGAGCVVDFSVSDESKSDDELETLIESNINETDISGIQAAWDRMTQVFFSGMVNTTTLLCRGVGCSVGKVPVLEGGTGWYSFPNMNNVPGSIGALENSLLLDISNQYNVPTSSLYVQLTPRDPGMAAVFSVASSDPQVQQNADDSLTHGDILLPLLGRAYASLKTGGSVYVDKTSSRQAELTDRSYVLVRPVDMASFNATEFVALAITSLGLVDCEDTNDLFTVSKYGDTPYLMVTMGSCYRTANTTSVLALQFTEGSPSADRLRSAVLSSSICCKEVCAMAVFCTSLGVVEVDLSNLPCTILNTTQHCVARPGCAWSGVSCVVMPQTSPSPAQATVAPAHATVSPTPAPSKEDIPWFPFIVPGLGALGLLLVLCVIAAVFCRRKQAPSIVEAREEPKAPAPLTPVTSVVVHNNIPKDPPHLPRLQDFSRYEVPEASGPGHAIPARPVNLYPSPPQKVPFRLPPPPEVGDRVRNSNTASAGVGSYGHSPVSTRWAPMPDMQSPPPLLKALPYDPVHGHVEIRSSALPALSEINPLSEFNPLTPDVVPKRRTDRSTPQRPTLRHDEFDMSV